MNHSRTRIYQKNNTNDFPSRKETHLFSENNITSSYVTSLNQKKHIQSSTAPLSGVERPFPFSKKLVDYAVDARA